MTLIEPPPPITQSVVAALGDLGDCVCVELAATGAGATCWCGLYPGQQVSWEGCGECNGDACGMGYVRLAGVYPYEVFPVQTVDTRCTLPLSWVVEVGALRCFEQAADGEMLDPLVTTEAAVRQALDASALYRAIKCCGLEVGVQSYTPVGPLGGCVGGFWLAHLAVT